MIHRHLKTDFKAKKIFLIIFSVLCKIKLRYIILHTFKICKEEECFSSFPRHFVLNNRFPDQKGAPSTALHSSSEHVLAVWGHSVRFPSPGVVKMFLFSHFLGVFQGKVRPPLLSRQPHRFRLLSRSSRKDRISCVCSLKKVCCFPLHFTLPVPDGILLIYQFSE